MKKKGILLYIIALSSILFSLRANAQDNIQDSIKVYLPLTQEQYKASPLFQGVSAGVDIWGVTSKVLGSDYAGYEGFVEVNLKNRFLPIFEFGYGSTNTTNYETDIHYKTSAPFFRIGMNYNILYKKPYLPGYIFAGIRFGHTSFSYDVDAPNIVDPTWGNTSIPFVYNGVKTNMTWGELLFGLRAKVYKNFAMGWTLRYKVRLSQKESENTEAWYVPGFGVNNSTTFGLTYNLIYDLPF